MHKPADKRARVLEKAGFEPVLKTYIYLTGILILVVSLAGIVLLPVWLIAGRVYINRYFENLECELTTRALHFKKGVWFQTERTVPLDKIQDLTFKEGPILRYFGLSQLMIETAGNSAQANADMKLIGIVNSRAFREKVLDQRDEITDYQSKSLPGTDGKAEPPIFSEMIPLLKEMNDTLKRIEEKTGR
jgi:membrane protein YdbS with pleckstrin-like domain